MEKQTIYLESQEFTSQDPLVSGSPLPLLEKVSGRPCVLPACNMICDVCVELVGANLSGAGAPGNLMVGVFGDNDGGATHCEFDIDTLNDEEVCHMSCCCPQQGVLKSSVNDLPFEIDVTGGEGTTLTSGKVAVVIKYCQMPLGPKATKASPQEPIKFVITDVPFGNPSAL